MASWNEANGGSVIGAHFFEALARTALGMLLLLGPPLALPAVAQERPGPALELAAGWIGFTDDGIVSEHLIGGAARWFLLPRVSLGPEAIYIPGDNHSHLIVTGNLIYDLLAPTSGRPRQISPFIVAGGGMFQTRELHFNGTFTSREGAFTAGGGVRTLVGERVTIAIDGRIGWELHVRVSGVVGVHLGP
jgi:hypothetical protein